MRFKDFNLFDVSTFRAGKNIACRNNKMDTEKEHNNDKPQTSATGKEKT